MPQHPRTHISPNPISKFKGVGDSGTQKDDGDMVREHDKHLLPHDPTLGRKGRQVMGSSESCPAPRPSLEGKGREVQGVWRELPS